MHTTLYTSPLTIETANTANYAIYLNILNASSSTRNGTLEILQGDGTVMSNVSYSPLPAGNLTGTAVQAFQNNAQVTLVYGRVTVDDVAGSIRANLLLVDAKGNTLASVEAR